MRTCSCVCRLCELNLEETLVIVTSEHGETMDEHRCFFDHHGLYDANVCVPLILRCPGRVPAGQRLRGQVATFDIAPTILDYLGLGDLIAENAMIGTSVRPLAERGSQKGNYDALYLAECSWMRKHGIRTNDWKYIEALEPDFHGLPPVELYDLNEKPLKETTNMVDARPDVVADLKGFLKTGSRVARRRRKAESDYGTGDAMRSLDRQRGKAGCGGGDARHNTFRSRLARFISNITLTNDIRRQRRGNRLRRFSPVMAANEKPGTLIERSLTSNTLSVYGDGGGAGSATVRHDAGCEADTII